MDMDIDEIIASCHKINTKPNVIFGEAQDVYESKDGQKRYYINRKNGVAYLYATQRRGEFISVVKNGQKKN